MNISYYNSFTAYLQVNLLYNLSLKGAALPPNTAEIYDSQLSVLISH